MTYWLDTNVFIQCANKIYTFQRWPEFWKFLSVKFEAQVIRSSEFVYEEMVKGKKADDFLGYVVQDTQGNRAKYSSVRRRTTLLWGNN